jgi:ribonuclease HI
LGGSNANWLGGFQAKLWGEAEELQLAWKLGINKLQLQVDSQAVVQSIANMQLSNNFLYY